MKPLLIPFILAFALPVRAGVLAEPMAAAGELVQQAHVFAADSADRALAALYERLFALQDLKRAAELKDAKIELAIDDYIKAYKKHDRFITKELLKEIALDPEHRRYPRITETAKLEIVESVAKLLREQQIGAIELGMIERDIADVKRMIQEYLEARPEPAQ